MIRVFVLALVVASTGAGEAADQQFAALVANTYGFVPTKLSEAEKSAKSDAMDEVWTYAKSHRKEAIAFLRSAIAQPDADPFFAFDGANLLGTLDHAPESQRARLAGYTRTDITQVALRDWIRSLAALALDGLDTTPAAEQWLRVPGLRYSLPEHGGYMVEGSTGALFLYGPADEKFATPALAAIARQKDHPGRETAFALLANQATTDAIAAVVSIPDDGLTDEEKQVVAQFRKAPPRLTPRAEPKLNRDTFVAAFRAIVDHDDWKAFDDLKERDADGEVDAVAVLTADDIPLVRRVRRMRIARGHQHAMEDYDSFTAILMTMVTLPKSP